MNEIRLKIRNGLPLQFKVVSVYLMIATFSWGSGNTSSSVGHVDIVQAFMRMMPVLFAILYFIILDLYRNGKSIRRLGEMVVAPFLVYSISSAVFGFFSLNPLLSLWKSFEFISVVLWFSTAYSLRLGASKDRLFSLVAFVLIALGIWLIISACLNPSVGWFFQGAFRLNGVLPIVNPNALGFYFLFILIITFTLHRTLFYILFIPCFLLFILSASRSSYVAFILIAFVFLIELFIKPFKRMDVIRIVFAVFVVIVLSLFVSEISKHVLRGAEGFSSLEEGSGRFVFWKVGMEEIWSNFPAGRGIGSSTRYLYLDYEEIKKSVSMHNSALELVLNAGFFGAILVCMFLYKGFQLTYGYFAHKSDIIIKNLDLMIYITLFARFMTSSSLASFQIELFLLFILFLPNKSISN